MASKESRALPLSPPSLCLDEFQRLGGADDTNALVLPAKAEQVFVARDNQVRLCCHGACNDMIIVWVVFDYARHIVWRDYVRHASQFTDDV